MANAFDPGMLEVLSSDRDNTIARYGNVFLQIRTGRMTLEALARIESAALLARAQMPGSVGGIAVLEEGAEVVDRVVREAQREVVAGLVADPRTHVTAVTMGRSVKAMLLRSVVRLLVPSRPRMHMARDLDDAIRWLATALTSPGVEELRQLVAHVRAHARGGTGT